MIKAQCNGCEETGKVVALRSKSYQCVCVYMWHLLLKQYSKKCCDMDCKLHTWYVDLSYWVFRTQNICWVLSMLHVNGAYNVILITAWIVCIWLHLPITHSHMYQQWDHVFTHSSLFITRTLKCCSLPCMHISRLPHLLSRHEVRTN